MVADRIKTLRESGGMTQAELAKRLGISRSSVNAWEQGISSPSTQYVVELSHIFKVSTDYLLMSQDHSSVDVSGLSSRQVSVIVELVNEFRSVNHEEV